MALEVIMPKAGIDMQEGQIVKWHIKEGEFIKQGDILLEIMTDKVNMELEAEEDGYLIKIIKGEGETVPVTEVIGYLGQEGELPPTGDAKPEAVTAPSDVTETIKKDRADDAYDIAVIGGGPAGYVAAIRAAQLGAKVALVEKSVLGGTCLNKGCIPTKTYLKNAEIIENILHANKRGIMLTNENYVIDMKEVVSFKNSVVKTLTNGVQGLLKSNKVDVIVGTGKINKNKEIVVDDKIIKADKIILAGGSKVSKLNISGLESKFVMSSDEILNLEEIPKSLAIIGGGVVGVELGLAFHTFGCKVTVVEMADRIVPAMDKESSVALKKSLESRGMVFLTSTKLEEIVEEKDGLSIKLEGKEDLKVSRALVSIGRVPDLEGIGEVNFELDRGRIKVDEFMETSIKGIYAPGDINGIKMLAHAAFRMGEVAAENAIRGNHRKTQLDRTPAVIYTIPEVAMVGLTEEQAREKYEINVGRFNFAGNGRALASGEAVGFVKVIADKKYGEILGVHIVGPSAAEIINQAAIFMEMEITVEEVIKTIYGHPTYSEALYEACADVLGEAIHLPKKNK